MSAVLNPGMKLKVGDSLKSPNGKFELRLQGDGNLVLYQDGKFPLWYSATAGQTASEAEMQTDGNFVLYGPGKKVLQGGSNASKVPTYTQGNAGAWIQLQDDGNLVVYKPGPKHLWATYTFTVPPDGNKPSNFPISHTASAANAHATVTVDDTGIVTLEMHVEAPFGGPTMSYEAVVCITGYHNGEDGCILMNHLENHTLTAAPKAPEPFELPPFKPNKKDAKWILNNGSPSLAADDVQNIRHLNLILNRQQTGGTALERWVSVCRDVGVFWDATDTLYKKVKHSELGTDIALALAFA